MKEAVVVIPMYRLPSADEWLSLRRTMTVLKAHDLVALVPDSLDAAFLPKELRIVRVSDEWLGARNGIAGYNRMMLSAAFYELFSEYDYLLICHTDAWIFRDELSAWCAKGYDCVAAPWVRRPIYDFPLLKAWLTLRRMSKKSTRQNLYGRVGNGGLSLRKVDRFREACVDYAGAIAARPAGHLGNEDVFWATVPRDFRYPSWREALEFAFDTHPAYGYKVIGERLPMGCHAWSKPRYRRFWGRFIPFSTPARRT